MIKSKPKYDPRKHGGYAKKLAPREPKDTKPKEVAPAPPPPKPLPPGLPQALTAMAKLSRYLKDIKGIGPFTVSVDLEEDQWVLVTRGFEVPFPYWEGYYVKYKKSAFIKNPHSKTS